MRDRNFLYVLAGSVRKACPVTMRTTLWLLRIMLPVSLAVTLMQHYGIIGWMAQYLDPLFRYIGLPGSSAIAFLTGAFVTSYAGMAAMLSIEMTLRQATIVTLMMCICHALPMESTVIKKTGSSFWRMSVIRLIMAFVCAIYLNIVLPEMNDSFGMIVQGEGRKELADVFAEWCLSSLKLSLMIFFIIFSLMILQRIMDAYNLIPRLSRSLRPLMKIFGLPDDASYMWLVGNVLGISYGCAVMLDLEEQGVISREEANDVNYHLIMNHSMIEDTLVFAAIGISAFWILSTRMLFALIVVWGRRALRLLVSSIG